MKISMLILIVLTTKAVCSKHVPARRKNNPKTTAYPCCITDQFTLSFVGSVGSAVNDQPRGIRVYLDAAVDFLYDQYGKDVTFYYYDYGYYEKLKVYTLKNMNVQYILYDTGECYEIPIGQALPFQCVPAYARYDKSFYIGNMEMFLDSWTTKGTFFDGQISVSVTDECVPVVASAAGTSPDYTVSFVVDGAFMNFTDIIYDQDYWFTPPSACYNATKIKSQSRFKSLRLLKLMQETNLFL